MQGFIYVAGEFYIKSMIKADRTKSACEVPDLIKE
jgi:hypothetical protein